jgi:aspartokinase
MRSGGKWQCDVRGLNLAPLCVQVIVATGFIAKNPAGQVTTLKRNGSDYSATIMGALVRASEITIWTDVDGVFSADPRKVMPNTWP